MPLIAYLDNFPECGECVFVHPTAQVMGEVTLGKDCSVWCNAVLRGDVNRITIGNGTNFQDLAMGHVTHKTPDKPSGSPLIIGSFVTVGHAAILHGCHIEDECLIGMGSIVLDEAILQKHVLLGAGSLVPPGKILESGYLYLGRPAVKIRPLTPDEIAHFRYSAQHYISVKDHYLGVL